VSDLAALKLQIEWGADEALEEAPVDRFRATVASEPQAPPPLAGGGRGEGARVTPAQRAQQAAAAAMTLEELRAAMAEFEGCVLRDTASHTIFAEGDPRAPLVLIGEPPGADDDRSGLVFAGAAGEYLDRMLAAINLARTQLLLTPLLPWRPPGDRPPSPTELALCLPFLHRLIALVAPRRLLIMGLLPSRSLLPRTTSRRRLRGEWINVPIPGTSLVIPTLPTFSAMELMKAPENRRLAWDDLRLLRRTLDEDGP
jgi:uracil-DNA glycosylase family 4